MASNLQARLNSGDFVVTAEITPPVSTDPAEFLSRALPLKGLATAVNVTDGAGAKVHLSSLAAAHFLVQNGIAPISSARSARWMREKLFGTLVPDAIVSRLEKAADAKREGRRICIEILQG